MWRDFAWPLGQYPASLDVEYLTDFEKLRKNPLTEVDSTLMGDKEKSRSSFLCSLSGRIVEKPTLAGIETGFGKPWV